MDTEEVESADWNRTTEEQKTLGDKHFVQLVLNVIRMNAPLPPVKCNTLDRYCRFFNTSIEIGGHPWKLRHHSDG